MQVCHPVASARPTARTRDNRAYVALADPSTDSSPGPAPTAYRARTENAWRAWRALRRLAIALTRSPQRDAAAHATHIEGTHRPKKIAENRVGLLRRRKVEVLRKALGEPQDVTAHLVAAVFKRSPFLADLV